VRSLSFIQEDILTHPPPVALAIDDTIADKGNVLRIRNVPKVSIATLVAIPSTIPTLVVLASEDLAINAEGNIK